MESVLDKACDLKHKCSLLVSWASDGRHSYHIAMSIWIKAPWSWCGCNMSLQRQKHRHTWLVVCLLSVLPPSYPSCLFPLLRLIYGWIWSWLQPRHIDGTCRGSGRVQSECGHLSSRAWKIPRVSELFKARSGSSEVRTNVWIGRMLFRSPLAGKTNLEFNTADFSPNLSPNLPL